MSKEKSIDRLYEYDATLASRNILLAKVCDALVLEGVIRPDAVNLILQMKAHECVVANGEVSLDNTDLETAVRRMAVKMPLLAPPVDYVDPEKDRRERWKEEAKAGSVQALGFVYKDFVERLGERGGEAAFKQWQAEVGATKIGKPATGVNAAAEAALKAVDSTKPEDTMFLRLRPVAGGPVDKAVEAEISRYTDQHGFASTKRKADEQGRNLSGHELRRKA